ncbi:hypothetical protein ANANG_G00147550 [Anguilla anguilla]|uniref:Schlafen GTPase-like domain-containing protein n=1 Tax=Anguilla anguilla TaxID=7936 RepID=A0A9D3RWZ1_ANGAN|nr:hypothetical protein ANANG_G00147550 [Anguilla anguilla]
MSIFHRPVVLRGYPDQVLSVGRVTLGEQARKAMKQKQRKESKKKKGKENKEKEKEENKKEKEENKKEKEDEEKEAEEENPKEKQKEAVLRAACALLNTGGGIIQMEAENQDYSYSTDALGQDLERALKELVNPARMDDFFEFSQQGTKFLMFVKSWCSSIRRARICSINTGLCQRSETSAEQVSSSAANELLQKKKRKNSLPCLYTVVEKGSLDVWEYATSTAFHLKQKLVNVGGCSERVCVVPKLVHCRTLKLIPREKSSPDGMLYPDCYTLGSEDQIRSVLRSLVIVLLSFTSALSDKLGCEFLNLLTEEQFEFLQTYEDIRELFIHGLPGTGKTVLAAEKIKRIKNAYDCKDDNVLYICENQPLKYFMR